MIKLVINHEFAYDASNIARLFIGKKELNIVNHEALENDQSLFQAEGAIIHSLLYIEGDKIKAKAAINEDGKKSVMENEFSNVSQKQAKDAVKLTLYKLLSNFYNRSLPWGILTGIRPLKIVHDLMDKGKSAQEISHYMAESYLVSDEKIRLAIEVASIERKFLYPTDMKKVSIYIGIPFCPTRCHYCSFTSNSLKTCGGMVEDYLQAMFHEMEQTKLAMNKYGLEVQTIYIGGGTPTSLDEDQLGRLLKKAKELFGGSLEEFTCEAGRPDTITEGKLRVMKELGVNRISINPQSMNDETLIRIGRAHTTEETIRSFKLAREIGFDNINMDIILGLPGEGVTEVQQTLMEIAKLQPESLTVHTMAIKRASIINESSNTVHQSGSTTEMMKLAAAYAKENGLHPYYLYRQKHMVENLENTGYCKPGYDCIYNIQIIEEKQTNIAFGADAITKTVYLDENRIERQGNIKDIKLYIERIDEQVDKKLKLLEELYKHS